MTRITVAITTTFLMLFAFLAGPALADHGVAHNGETAEFSKTEGLTQDEVVTVTGIGYAPGATLTVVQCFIFPASGPTDCELSNYGQYTAEVGDDGSASVDYIVNIVDGQCDPDNPCFIVISDGIGPAANGVGMEVTFASADAAEPEDAVVAPPEDEPVDEPAEEPVAEPTDEPVDEPAETDDADADVAETDDADADDDDEDDDGGSGWVIPVIIGVVVLGGVGAFLATRKKE